MRSGSPGCSNLASGSSRATATCGAGMASRSPPMRRPARLTANREEATAARQEAEHGIGALPPAHDIEAQLATVRGEIEQHRAHVAEVRAEAQAFAREAEMAERRLTQIADERAGWTQRK